MGSLQGHFRCRPPGSVTPKRSGVLGAQPWNLAASRAPLGALPTAWGIASRDGDSRTPRSWTNGCCVPDEFVHGVYILVGPWPMVAPVPGLGLGVVSVLIERLAGPRGKDMSARLWRSLSTRRPAMLESGAFSFPGGTKHRKERTDDYSAQEALLCRSPCHRRACGGGVRGRLRQQFRRLELERIAQWHPDDRDRHLWWRARPG